MELNKLDILAFGAHPDDIEMGCGATLAKHIRLGKKVGLIDLTLGELGTRGTVETRLKEAETAVKILGSQIRENLKMADGFFANDKPHQLSIIKTLRKYRPDIVLANSLIDRHPDHARAARLVADACFLSGLAKIETENNGSKQLSWRPKSIYHYLQFKSHAPSFVIDVSGFMEIKMNAIRAHQSQFHDKNSKEPETFISQADFLNSLAERASDLGRTIGVQHAEGFMSERILAVDSFSDLLLTNL
jgi:bacillithiol biosynthesis deacetylase BshB1